MKKLRKSLTRRLSSGLSKLTTLASPKSKTSSPRNRRSCEMCGAIDEDGKHRTCVECGMTLCYGCKQEKFEKISKGQYTCGDRRHSRRRKEREFASGYGGSDFEIDPKWVIDLDSPFRLSESPFQCPKHPFYDILKRSFFPRKVSQIAHFEGVQNFRKRVRRSSKMVRLRSALENPARDYLDWRDAWVSRGAPLGAELKDEWSVTEITFGQCFRNLDALLAFCFQFHVTHEAMRVTVKSVMNFLGSVAQTTLCVIAFESNKQFRVSSSDSSGGWWGRLEIVDATGLSISNRKTLCSRTSSKNNIDPSIYFSDVSGSHSPTTPTNRTIMIPRSDTATSIESRFTSEDEINMFTADELHDNQDKHVLKIHSKSLVQITRSASKSWGTHYVHVNQPELLSFLKRTRITNLLNMSSIRDDEKNIIVADYLCRAISHMGDTFQNVSSKKTSSSKLRVGISAIPIPRSFRRWYEDFHKQVILSCEPETGCIEGNCEILMADGSLRRAQDIVPGERVCTSTSSRQRHNIVICTIHQILNPNMTAMCKLSEDCVVTPEHPVRKSSESSDWILPKSAVLPKPCEVSVLCNFVLALRDHDNDAGHCVVIGDFECVTLGHCSEPQHKIWGGMGIRRYLQAQSDYPRVRWYGRISGERLRKLEHDVVALN